MSKTRILSSFYWSFFFIVLFTARSNGQQNFTIRWYTSDNNELPQVSVKAIVKDKYNFLWMTTENGLVRYDGNNFIVYNSSTTPIKDGRFVKILGNVKSDSLYCSNLQYLILLNQRKIKFLPKSKEVYIINRKGKDFWLHDGIPSLKTISSYASYFIKLSNGNFYFVDNEYVELCDSRMRSIFKYTYRNNNVFNFFTINDTLYYLKENGEYDYFLQDKKISGKINAVLFKDKFKLYWNITANQVFVNSKNKLYYLSTQNNKLSLLPILELKDLNKNNIISILYDNKNRKLYLGSTTNGLCIISFLSFKAIKRESQNADIYYSAVPYNSSSVISADGFILNGDNKIDSIPFKRSYDYNERILMAKDAEDDIWIGRGFNAFCYSKNTRYKNYKQYHFNQPIKTLYKSWDNTIWISLSDYEGYKSQLHNISKYKTESNLATVVRSNINYISQYDYNTLYLGCEKGLYSYDIKFKKLTFIKNSKALNIRSVFIDSGKKIWITTYEKGFFLYSDNTLVSFPTDKNKYLNSSHCIIEDKKGFFWITTNKGLFQVSRETLLKYSKNKTRKIYYHRYDKNDGFLTSEFNGGCQPCGNYLQNDNIAFPSMNGMVFFNANKISPVVPNNEIFLDKIIMDQKVLLPKDTIDLDKNFKRIKFFIAYPYYGNSENLNIEAKLNGTTEGKWEKISADRTISFTSLPPGEYELTFRNLSGFTENYKYKTILLKVPAKFYQTFWFNMVCLILVIILTIFTWHLRVYYIKLKNKKLKLIIAEKTKKIEKTVNKLKSTQEKLKKEAKQQEMMVKSISHDIKSPLKFLTSSIFHLFDDAHIKKNEKSVSQIETIYKSTNHLYEYVENLIKYSTIFIEGKKLEEESYSLYNLVYEKIQIFEKIAQTENTVIVNHIDQNTIIKTNKKALSIITHNLMDNAIKHTKNGKIEIISATQGNMLILCIKDNGKGMSQDLIDYYVDFSRNPTVKNYHQGLHMIIELLSLLEGKINIASKINEGTSIEIIIQYI